MREAGVHSSGTGFETVAGVQVRSQEQNEALECEKDTEEIDGMPDNPRVGCGKEERNTLGHLGH